MIRINVHLKNRSPRTYPILIQSGLLTQWLPETGRRLVILTDHAVKKHYGVELQSHLERSGYVTDLYAFRPGESSKSIETKCRLEKKMLAAGCGRDTLILALGGGVVGDLAGFIAATYMRGIPYIQIPTTLLAMVDSSVGGKTGIDTPLGKNLIGAFWQPRAVIADLDCLKSLSQKQMMNGLFEMIKIFLVADPTSFTYFQKKLDEIVALEPHVLAKLLARSVKIKAKIVQADEQEQHRRMILNFGHTIGHALEQVSGYKLLHGYAVAYGMLVEAKIAQLMGHLDETQFACIKELLARLNITPKGLKKFDMRAVIHATQFDKKKQSGQVSYVLLAGMGRVVETQGHFVHVVPDRVVKAAFLMGQI